MIRKVNNEQRNSDEEGKVHEIMNNISNETNKGIRMNTMIVIEKKSVITKT